MLYHTKFYLGDYVRQIKIRELVHDNENKEWVNAANIEGATPLHIAAGHRNLQLFRLLLPYYTKIETTDYRGNTILHVLADTYSSRHKEFEKERDTLFCILISKGADVNKRNKFEWTPMHYAAKHCHADLLKILKMAKADFTLKTVNNETPLLLACKYMLAMKDTLEGLKTIGFLLNRDCDVNTVDDEGFSALHYAVKSCNNIIVEKLLEKGANVHVRTKEHNLTPLHLAVKKENNLPVVKMLMNAGAVAESSETEVLTPLHVSLSRDSSEVVDYLIKNGANVNCLEKNLQFTPLHIAIYQQRYDMFQHLVDNGADVNGSGEDGLTPLHLSSMLGYPQFTEALISLGAKVDCLYDNHLTPLHLATIKSHLVDDSELMGADAIRHGHKKSLIVKLLKYPYDPIGQDYEAVIRLLVLNGADVNAVTKCGWNVLQYAVVLGRHSPNFVEALLELGANVDYKEPSSRLKALHYASMNSYVALVKLLINAGDDVNALTPDGKGPLHLALESNCINILKMLVSHGAKLHCKGKRCFYTLLYMISRNNDEDAIDELHDDQKMPILQAIYSLEDNDIKKALMCLWAIMDDSNESGCMAVNSEIENDYYDNTKSLRINRVNVQDSEVYSKFACDRVLSGTLQELSYPHVQNRESNYVYDYLSMLNAVQLPLSDNCITYSRTQSIADFYSSNKLKTHYNSSQDEVEKLKEYLIDDRLSLYEVLHMRPKYRRFYLKRLNLAEIQSEFQIYYNFVLARYREDVIKKALLDAAQSALYQFTGVDVPIICVEEIFADIGVMNMIATIEAAEIDESSYALATHRRVGPKCAEAADGRERHSTQEDGDFVLY